MIAKHAFLVSLWVEPATTEPEDDPLWRGSIEHLDTRKRRYFKDMSELVRFLADWTGSQDRG